METQIRPAFEVHKLEGTQPHTVIKYVPTRVKVGEFEEVNEDGDTVVRNEYKIKHVREVQQVTRPLGRLVITARGDAIHVPSDDMARRHRLDGDAPLVDMATGEEFKQPDRSLKALASRAGALLPDSVTLTPQKGGKS